MRKYNVQKFKILVTSNIFCTKTVSNRFSSYSLKPRIASPSYSSPFSSIPHLWRHLHRSRVHFCAAYNHLDEIQTFRSDCCIWFSRGLGRTIRPAVVLYNYFHVLVLGASLGLTAPPTSDGPFSPLLEVNITLNSIIYSFTAQSWLMVDVKHSIDLWRTFLILVLFRWLESFSLT